MLGRILTIAALCALPAAALTPDRELTQYVHRIWQTQQGLPDGAITRILQDPTGYIWLATETGFHRFDGVRFTPAERVWPTAPAGLNVRAAALDPTNTFWLGGNDGNVYAVRPGGTTKYTQELGLPAGQIQCMFVDESEAVWTCFEGGLTRITAGDKPSIQVFGPADGLPDDNMHAACTDTRGRIWTGGDGPQIAVGTNGKFQIHPLKGLPETSSVRTFLCTEDTIWVGGSAGLVRVNAKHPEEQTWYTAKDGLAENWVFTIMPGSNGVLWLGTRAGVTRMREGRFDSFGPHEGLSQSWAQAVMEDQEGSLWVGTKRGLNQFTDGRIVLYSANEGLPGNEAGPVFQDSHGVIWAGTLDAGLARFDGRRFIKIGAQGLPSNVVRSIIEEPGRALWVGTSNGIASLVNGRVATRYGVAEGLPVADVRVLFRDRDGVLWAGTSQGLASLSNGRFVEHPGAPKGLIRCIGQDRDGRILVGADEGIYIQGKDGFKPLTQGEIYMRNSNAFLLDKDGLLWVAMNGGGLRMIDGDKVYQFLSRDGLYDAEILGLAIDDADRMWMSCSRGIFWVSRASLRQHAAREISMLTSTAYTPTESQRVIEGRLGVSPSMWRMRDGHLWLSTARGVIAIDPARPSREPPPPVVIENPVVNGAPMEPERISSLPGGQKNIQFNFAGLSYLQPERIRYKYRLEGYDKDWVDAGTRHDAIYANLPHGDYRFQVTACNYDGSCNDQGALVSFTLVPLFYERALFWPLMVALAGAFGWLGYQLHIRRLRERYDLIVSERNRIARELHDTLIQGFSGITMALQALSTRIRTPEERDTLNDIIHDAATCLRETRQSVAGLRAAPGPHSGLTAAVERAVREITETKHVRARLELETVTRNFAPEVEYNLLRILREAVNNAVKHSGADTIDVTLRNRADALTLTIRDDGSGFDRDHAAPGPGHYGLIGMKERASQIGAALQVDSQPGAGTTISVTLPASVPAGRALELST